VVLRRTDDRGEPGNVREEDHVTVSQHVDEIAYFRPAELIGEIGLPQRRELAMHRWFARTMSRTHRGQAFDLTVRVGALAQADVAPVARAIAELKTGALTAFAARLGATAAAAPSQVVEALSEFGSALGIALQQLDDSGGILSARMRDKGHEDLRLERVTFPWALLSTQLDAGSYRALRDRIVQDDPPAREALRASLRESLLALDGPEAPKRALARALDTLQDELGVERAALAEIEDEIARLEVSFG
jgi:geranylgeranyl pyrophosphate synthase